MDRLGKTGICFERAGAVICYSSGQEEIKTYPLGRDQLYPASYWRTSCHDKPFHEQIMAGYRIKLDKGTEERQVARNLLILFSNSIIIQRI